MGYEWRRLIVELPDRLNEFNASVEEVYKALIELNNIHREIKDIKFRLTNIRKSFQKRLNVQ